MANPVKIVVTAETQAAAAELQKFLAGYSGKFDDLGKAAQEAGKHTEGLFAQNRMALMELEHVARATMDSLIAGINPIRTLAMEAPRIAEASANMSGGLFAVMQKFLPVIGGVAAAVAAGAVAWHYYGDALIDPQKRAKELADELEKIPGILGKIETAQRAGTISPTMAERYRDMLSGKTPLYNQTTVGDAFGGHASTIGTGAFGVFGTQIPQLTTDPNIRNSRTGQIIGTRQLANSADTQKYVEAQMRADKTVMANNDQNPGTEALAKLHELELKIQRDAEVGPEKQMSRIRDRYELERREIGLTRDIAQAAHKWTAEEEVKYQATISASKIAEQNSLAEITEKMAEESLRKTEATERQWTEEKKTIVKAQNEELEDAILAQRETTTDKTKRLYQAEYTARITLYQQQLDAGVMDEDEYTHKILEAGKARAQGEREYNAQLERTAQLKLEIARAETQAKLTAIQGNPYLSKQQKDDQSLALYQQQKAQLAADAQSQIALAGNATDPVARLEYQKKYLQLKEQESQVQLKINAATQTFGQTFQQTLVRLQDQWGSWAQQVSSSFASVFNSAVSSISRGITGLIEGTTTWGRALMQIGTSILNDVIQAIVQMGVRWVLTQVMMAIAGKAIQASALAASAPIAMAQSAIWAVPATLSTIATLGASAAAAPGEIALASAATLGLSAFAAGGRPPTGVPSLVGERGPELFVPDSAGTIIPADKTAAMMSQGGSSFGGGGMGGTSVTVSTFLDPQALSQHLQKSDAHEKWVVDVMRKNAHKFA